MDDPDGAAPRARATRSELRITRTAALLGAVARLLLRLLVPLVGWTLSIASSRALGLPVHWWGVRACIAGVHAAYAFDALADSGRLRALWRERQGRSLFVCAAALFAAVGSDRTLAGPLVILAVLGVAYVPLKRWVPKNLLTASAWVAAVMLLSLHGAALTWETGLYGAGLFLILLANVNLCDLPDVAADRTHAVVAVAPRLGIRAAGRLAGILALAGCALVLALGSGAWPLVVPGAIYAALGLLRASMLADRPDRRWLVDAALLSVGPLSLLDELVRGG